MIFQFKDYRIYLESTLKNGLKKGTGPRSALSKAIGIHSSLLTRILKGENNLTLDQAWKCAEYYQLSTLETEYFLTLVDLEKVVEPHLKNFFQKKLLQIKNQYESPRNNSNTKTENTKDIEKSTFYSYWFYSAIRLLTSIPNYQNATSIAKYLNLKNELVEQVLEFLVDTGLCKKEGTKYLMNKNQTWLTPDSPHLFRHYLNWRMKALNDLHQKTLYSARGTLVMALSEDALLEAQKKTRIFIEEIRQLALHSPSEKLAYFNVDLLDI